MLKHKYHREYMGKWVVLDCGRLVTFRSSIKELTELDGLTSQVIKDKDYYLAKV